MNGSASLAKKRQKNIRAYDVFFFCAFCLLIAGYLYMVRTGLGVPDESFYVTIPHRLMQGDRLILDDWHVSQFSSFMQYPFVKLFYDRAGSLDGVILYLRYLYVVFQAVTLAVMYPFFRKYGWGGAAALTVFGGYVPVMLPTLNYYTLCLWPAAIVCTVLFMGKPQKAPVLVVLGILTALAVLAEPMIGIAYFIYTLFVLTRQLLYKKRPGFLEKESYYVCVKVWGFLTVGILIAAAAFLVFLFRGSDPVTTLKAIPYLFNGYEYNFSLSGGNIQTLKVVRRALSLYGNIPAIGIAAVTAAAFVFRKKRTVVRPFILASLLVFVLWALVNALRGDGNYYALFYGMPLYLSGPALYLMCEEHDGKLWTFWCAGAVLSVLLDISSAVILGVCGALSGAVTLIWLFRLIGECVSGSRPNAEERKKSGRAFAVCGAMLSVCLMLSFVGFDVYDDVFRLDHNFTESDWSFDFTRGKADTLLERGAYKGIKTTSTLAAKYNAMLDDLDEVKENCEGTFLIYDRFPYAYLYTDCGYATFSAWYVDSFEDDRLLYYYEVYPEKVPQYVYVPDYDPYTYRTDPDAEKKVGWFAEHFDCTAEHGKAGTMIYINR